MLATSSPDLVVIPFMTHAQQAVHTYFKHPGHRADDGGGPHEKGELQARPEISSMPIWVLSIFQCVRLAFKCFQMVDQ